jgi:hypothetical protein
MQPRDVSKDPEQWAVSFQRASNADPELQANGKHFSCKYLLDMKEHSAVVKVHEGKTEEVVVDPGALDEHYQFALRASPETWSKFAEKIPEPMYHGIWAASFRRDMRMDGDLLVLMQNLRCVTRQLELLRITGVPVSA